MVDDISNQKKLDKIILDFKKANYQKVIDDLCELKKKTNHFLISWYLGHAYFRIHNYSKALESIKKSIELKQPDILNLSFLAEIYLQINEHSEATKIFNRILKIDSKNINSFFNLAKINLQLGNIEEAKKLYKEILELEPLNFSVWYELIKIDKKHLTKDLIVNSKKIISNGNKVDLNFIYSKLILAENGKNLKNFEDEINNLMLAHNHFFEIKKKAAAEELNYYSNLLPAFIEKVKNSEFNPDSTIRPIFIMGLPRSGTTLIENIITSSKNEILSGGETEILSKVFFSKKIIYNYKSKELLSNFSFYKKDFEELQSAIISQYQEINLNIVDNIFTDKSLENLLYYDLIEKIFPNAKFVYCKRNNLANFIGILKVFLPNLLWSHSIDNIIVMMNLYNDKINKLLLKKKKNFKIIELENFSNNPSELSKDLFNFLEMRWDEKILDTFHNKERLIKTVSNLQVRSSIKKHDLSYIKNYIPFLQEFKLNRLV